MSCESMCESRLVPWSLDATRQDGPRPYFIVLKPNRITPEWMPLQTHGRRTVAHTRHSHPPPRSSHLTRHSMDMRSRKTRDTYAHIVMTIHRTASLSHKTEITHVLWYWQLHARSLSPSFIHRLSFSHRPSAPLTSGGRRRPLGRPRRLLHGRRQSGAHHHHHGPAPRGLRHGRGRAHAAAAPSRRANRAHPAWRS